MHREYNTATDDERRDCHKCSDKFWNEKNCTQIVRINQYTYNRLDKIKGTERTDNNNVLNYRISLDSPFNWQNMFEASCRRFLSFDARICPWRNFNRSRYPNSLVFFCSIVSLAAIWHTAAKRICCISSLNHCTVTFSITQHATRCYHQPTNQPTKKKSQQISTNALYLHVLQ